VKVVDQLKPLPQDAHLWRKAPQMEKLVLPRRNEDENLLEELKSPESTERWPGVQSRTTESGIKVGDISQDPLVTSAGRGRATQLYSGSRRRGLEGK
jgi:hypothetical protein